MTIVRVGLAETKRFGAGWDAIFGGKSKGTKAAAGKKKAKGGAKKKKRR